MLSLGCSAAKMLVGSVVRIVSSGAGGEERVIFSDAKGLQSANISMTESSLLKMIRNIAVKNGDLLAPLKAAASLMDTIHEATMKDPSLKVGQKPSQLNTMVESSPFADRILIAPINSPPSRSHFTPGSSLQF